MSGKLRDSTPSRFKHKPKTQTGRSRRAFKLDGPGTRLMVALSSNAYVFRLRLSDFCDLSDHPSGLYLDHLNNMFKALERTFSGPIYAVAEVGQGDFKTSGRGRLHIHVIAHKDDGPQHIPRDTERCKRVYDAPGLYRYLAKEPEHWSLEAELDHAATCVLSSTGKPPRTRRHFLASHRLEQVAHCTNDLTLSDPSPLNEPERARALSTSPSSTMATTYPNIAKGANHAQKPSAQARAAFPSTQTTSTTSASAGTHPQTAPVRPLRRWGASGPSQTPAPSKADHSGPAAAARPRRHGLRRQAARFQRAPRVPDVRRREVSRRVPAERVRRKVAYPTRRFGRLYRPENPQIALLRVWFVRCAARAPPQLHHDLMDETALQSQLQAARDELRYLERELPNFVRLRDENQRLAAPSRSCPRGQSRCCRAG